MPTSTVAGIPIILLQDLLAVRMRPTASIVINPTGAALAASSSRLSRSCFAQTFSLDSRDAFSDTEISCLLKPGSILLGGSLGFSSSTTVSFSIESSAVELETMSYPVGVVFGLFTGRKCDAEKRDAMFLPWTKAVDGSDVLHLTKNHYVVN